MNWRKPTIVSLFILGLITAFWLGYYLSFSDSELEPREIREKISQKIKENHLQPNGLVFSEPNKTTSEAQSYGLMMSALEDKKENFDLIWNWTNNNLRVREDNLFAWRWENDKITDTHSATDADQDIALALYYASRLWNDQTYEEESVRIIKDIWEKETKVVDETRYVSGGDWALEDDEGITVNPSYFSPYIYKIFAKLDREHDWLTLVDSTYYLLDKCSTEPGLPPDWCRIDNNGNVVSGLVMNNKPAANYSYDALRVPFRLALDYYLHGDERALAYLKANQVFLRDWKNMRKIFINYNQNGITTEKQESLANYGTLLAAYSLVNPSLAYEIFKEEIQKVNFSDSKSFYDLSWVWFGLTIYEKKWPELN